MAFGFPAYHQRVAAFDIDEAELLQRVYTAIDSLHWQITQRDDYYLTGKTISGALSMGERIYIEIKNGQIGLRSECAIPTQCVDFGKNKRNVEAFFAALEATLPE